MNERYNFREIEKKWQKYWADNNTFKMEEKPDMEKYYVLEMFPYPSGKLHMGHVRNYSIGDVVARFKNMQGYNVLHPMGFDSFGLPAENAAIKHGVAPDIWTWDNIHEMEEQLSELGLSYDWDREVCTCHPDYYKWMQWIFIQFYKKGLAYKKENPVNWCPDCQTVLANEQVVDGVCERCGAPVGKKNLSQWYFKITDYAERLLKNLDTLDGWPNKVKIMQKNWIGKSVGAEVDFAIKDDERKLKIFTTRVDTLFGVTYMVLAPEHPYVNSLVEGTEYEQAVKEYIDRCQHMSDIERTSTSNEKTGVFIGKYAINPVNGKEVPIYISDYVLMGYGTGAIMAVPAHDERDFDFATKFGLDIIPVVAPGNPDIDVNNLKEAFVAEGTMINSGKFDGMNNREAIKKVIEWVEEEGIGKATVNYRLRDWLISRQRYWGTPIPMIHCEHCGWVPEKEENLPVLLPTDIEFTGKGESPIATSKTFVDTVCPVCGAPAKREIDTMDTFLDSSWYFLRYCDPKNENEVFDKEKVKYWYDGFSFGQRKDLYNPWSITNFLDKKQFRPYWAATSSNGLVNQLIRTGSGSIKRQMECLISGESITVSFDEQIVYNQLEKDERAVWSLLLASGYLKVDEVEYRSELLEPWYHLRITNLETFANDFAKTTRTRHILLITTSRNGTQFRASSKERCRLVVDDMEICFLCDGFATDIGQLRNLTF